eukprot:3672950-Amphidinium_carterae.1
MLVHRCIHDLRAIPLVLRERSLTSARCPLTGCLRPWRWLTGGGSICAGGGALNWRSSLAAALLSLLLAAASFEASALPVSSVALLVT